MANNAASGSKRRGTKSTEDMRRIGNTINPHNRGAMNDLGNERPGDGGTRRTLPDQTTVDYKGSKSGGAWVNSNGTQTGYSKVEDDPIQHRKSTGDTAPGTFAIPYKQEGARANHIVDQYVNQQNRKQLRGR